MPEQDGAVFGSPACGDDTPADPPRRRWWLAAAAALVFLGWLALCRPARRRLRHRRR